MRLIDGLIRLCDALRGLVRELRRDPPRRVCWLHAGRAESVATHLHARAAESVGVAAPAVRVPEGPAVVWYIKVGRRYVPAN